MIPSYGHIGTQQEIRNSDVMASSDGVLREPPAVVAADVHYSARDYSMVCVHQGSFNAGQPYFNKQTFLI